MVKNMAENLHCLFSFHMEITIIRKTTQAPNGLYFCQHGSIFSFSYNNGWRIVLQVLFSMPVPKSDIEKGKKKLWEAQLNNFSTSKANFSMTVEELNLF